MADKEADYLAVVSKAELTQSKNKGTPQWTIIWTLMQEAVNGEWQIIQPFERHSNWSLGGASAPYTIKKLEAIGFNGDVDKPEFNEAATVNGVAVRCTISPQGYGDYDLVDWGGGPSFQPASASAKQAFKALWNTRNGPTKPAGKPAPPPPAGRKAVEAEIEKELDAGIPI